MFNAQPTAEVIWKRGHSCLFSQTGGAWDRTQDPWAQGKWFIHYIKAAPVIRLIIVFMLTGKTLVRLGGLSGCSETSLEKSHHWFCHIHVLAQFCRWERQISSKGKTNLSLGKTTTVIRFSLSYIAVNILKFPTLFSFILKLNVDYHGPSSKLAK